MSMIAEDLFPEDSGLNDPDPPSEPDAGGADSGADTSTPDAAPAEAPLIFGKYKTLEDAEKAHKDLERSFHDARKTPEPVAEPEPAFDPFAPTLVTPDELQQAAMQHPQETFLWAQQNASQLGWQAEQIQNELFQVWQSLKPMEAHRWLVRQELEPEIQKYRESQAPLEQQYTNTMIANAVETCHQQLPNFGDYQDRILQRIQDTTGLVDAINANPEYRNSDSIRLVITRAYNDLIAEDYIAQVRAAALQQQDAPAEDAKKPKTQTRSTTAPPSQDGIDEMFPAGAFN